MIQQCDKFALRQFQTSVAAVGHPDIPAVAEIFDPSVTVGSDDFFHRASGTVVDDQKLPVGISLRQNGLDCFPQKGFRSIIGRQNNRDQTCFLIVHCHNTTIGLSKQSLAFHFTGVVSPVLIEHASPEAHLVCVVLRWKAPGASSFPTPHRPEYPANTATEDRRCR